MLKKSFVKIYLFIGFSSAFSYGYYGNTIVNRIMNHTLCPHQDNQNNFNFKLLDLHPEYILERIDDEHRFGPGLNNAYKIYLSWSKNNEKKLSFWEWLNVFQINLPKVNYFTDEELEQWKIYFEKNKLNFYSGLRWKHGAELVFILNQYYHFYAIPSYKDHTKVVGHTSLSRGEPIVAAGVFECDYNGALRNITLNSGHYRPNHFQMYQMLKFLEKKLDLSSIMIKLLTICEEKREQNNYCENVLNAKDWYDNEKKCAETKGDYYFCVFS